MHMGAVAEHGGIGRRAALGGIFAGLAAGGAARAQAPGIEGVEWRAEDVLAAAIPDDAPVTLAIEAGRAAGRAGCNRFMGGVELGGSAPGSGGQAGGPLRFGLLAGTRMACPPALMEVEQKVFRAFEATRRYVLEPAGRLRLLDEQGATVMILVR